MTPEEGIEYLKAMPKDEPVFILRAQDKYAPSTIATWAGLLQTPRSITESASECSLKKAALARHLVQEIRTWQTAHPLDTKTPD